MRIKNKAMLPLIFLITGCVSIPDADVAFLDRRIKVGLDESEAIHRIEARGFQEASITPAIKWEFNEETESFDHLTPSLEETVQHNLGFIRLIGEPAGRLRCFHRRYQKVIANGVRIICWTADDANKLSWRQASWRGVSL